MRRVSVILLATAAALLLPAGAVAAPVRVLDPHGRVDRRDGAHIVTSTADPLGSSGGAGVGTGTGPGGTGTTRTGMPTGSAHKVPSVTVENVLAGLRRSGEITAAQDEQALVAFDAALAAERRLSGTRRAELTAVTTTVHQIAADHELWPSRLPAIEATLNANRQWWSSGTLLSYGERVTFPGSELEWEYYPGQGIQLQVLGSFSEANGLWEAHEYPQMEQLLSELIPLASDRGGGLTWEYYFNWEGGAPPWTSAMSQATALQALSHAYEATKNPYYLTIAAEALSVLTRTPAQGGVMVPTDRGVRFVQYSFTPGTAIINAFLQTLIGLDEYARTSGDATAARLFTEGNAEAEWEVPHYNTGAWSLYEPGEEDDLGYHELVTGFLGQLCTLTAAPVYCTTEGDFTTDLHTAPVLDDLTSLTRANRPFVLRLRLSKIARVGITVRRGSVVVFSTSATLPYGVQSVNVGKLHAGADTVTLTATDLAGNYAANPPAALTVTR